MTEIINEKVDLLYDFHILRHKKGEADPRENALRKMLAQCGNEIRIENTLREIFMERTTLSNLLKQKGLM